ncbi:MAG: hypothetical protein SVE93_06435 [Candidatus Thermoplasmatota archaeon]|nr:hypothetical protein [Candidatus Thermoplasmatota archaeon]
MILLSVVGSISALIAWVIEELTYLFSLIWMPVLGHISVGCLDFCAPMVGRIIQSGVGSCLDSSLDCLLQTTFVPCAVGVERVCMPYFVEILQQLLNILG